MDLAVWIAHLLATFPLSLTPGPGVFSSISSGLHHGPAAAKVLPAMSDPGKLRWVNRGLGSMFIAAGVALASFRRAAIAAA